MTDAAILWVEDYNRQQVSLSLSQKAAGGFAKEMGFSSIFEKKDNDVDEELFMPGSNGDAAPVDVAPILYYSGHGTENGPLLNDGSVADFKEISLGRAALSVAVFDCCRMLQQERFGQWKRSFVRLRYLLGMKGDVSQSGDRGRIFGSYLLGNPERTKKTIPEAWRTACIETGVQRWSVLRALPEDGNSDDEFWPIEDLFKMKPVSDQTRFVYTSETTPRPAIGSEATRARSEVRLLRTFKPDRAIERLKNLADLVELDFQEVLPRKGSQMVFGNRGSLEIYEESNSLWAARRRRSIDGELFRAAGGLRLSRGEVLEGAVTARFLQRLENQGYRLSEPREAFTVEFRENQDGSRSKSFQTARHLDFRLFWEDLPVLGPGAQVRVTAEDEVTELLRLSRRPADEGKLPILSADEASGLLFESSEFKALRRSAFRIFRWCLGYYSLPPRTPQDCLIPVYAFEGTCSTRALKDHHFVRYVQAVPAAVREHDFPVNSVLRTMPTVFS